MSTRECYQDEIVLDKKKWDKKVNSILKNSTYRFKEVSFDNTEYTGTIGYAINNKRFNACNKYTKDLNIIKFSKTVFITLEKLIELSEQEVYSETKEGKIAGLNFIETFFLVPVVGAVKQTYGRDLFILTTRYKLMDKKGIVYNNFRYKIEYSNSNKIPNYFILRCQRNVGRYWINTCSILSTLNTHYDFFDSITEPNKGKHNKFKFHLKNIYDTFFKDKTHLTLFEPEK